MCLMCLDAMLWLANSHVRFRQGQDFGRALVSWPRECHTNSFISKGAVPSVSWGVMPPWCHFRSVTPRASYQHGLHKCLAKGSPSRVSAPKVSFQRYWTKSVSQACRSKIELARVSNRLLWCKKSQNGSDSHDNGDCCRVPPPAGHRSIPGFPHYAVPGARQPRSPLPDFGSLFFSNLETTNWSKPFRKKSNKGLFPSVKFFTLNSLWRTSTGFGIQAVEIVSLWLDFWRLCSAQFYLIRFHFLGLPSIGIWNVGRPEIRLNSSDSQQCFTVIMSWRKLWIYDYQEGVVLIAVVLQEKQGMWSFSDRCIPIFVLHPGLNEDIFLLVAGKSDGCDRFWRMVASCHFAAGSKNFLGEWPEWPLRS